MDPHGGFNQTLVGIKLSTSCVDDIIICMCSAVQSATYSVVTLNYKA